MKTFEGYQKGVNLGGWLSQCVSYEKEHFETFILEEDIKRIAGWGMDHIRLPLDYDIIMEEDNTFKAEGFAYIDKCIGWCKKYHLNMILDLHKTKGYMFDDNVVPNPDLFFQDTSLQDDFIHIWVELATRYGQYHNFVTFELLNEVVNPAYATEWNKIACRAMKAIRQIAPDTYIIVGGTNNNSAMRVSEIEVPNDGKIVFTFHCYEPLIFTHQKAYWVKGMSPDVSVHYPATVEELRTASESISREQIGAIYQNFLDGADDDFFDALFKDAIWYANQKNVPLYCGEYGVIDRAELNDTVHWFEKIHAAFEKYHIGRAVWTYKAKDFGLIDEHFSQIGEEIKKLL